MNWRYKIWLTMVWYSHLLVRRHCLWVPRKSPLNRLLSHKNSLTVFQKIWIRQTFSNWCPLRIDKLYRKFVKMQSVRASSLKVSHQQHLKSKLMQKENILIKPVKELPLLECQNLIFTTGVKKLALARQHQKVVQPKGPLTICQLLWMLKLLWTLTSNLSGSVLIAQRGATHHNKLLNLRR